MEREGRGRRRRGGGEMRKIIGIMMIFLLVMSCGQQTDAAGGKSLSEVLLEVGRSTEKAFYTFLELVSDTLGFRVNKDTTRDKVGKYFSDLGKKIGDASGELEKVAEKAVADVDKDGILNKTIKDAVDVAKATLSVLKGHLEALNEIGDNNKVVEVASQQNGAAADTEGLKAAYRALKGIVETAKAQQVKEPSSSSVTLAQASIGGATIKNGAKILAAGAQAGEAVGDKAAAIVSAVSGYEMLAAIIKSEEGDATGTISGTANGNTSALKFARGHSTPGSLAQDEALAGAVAGGIALRSLVKEGKLAANTSNDDKAAQAAGVTAVNKLLVAVEDIIKKTVKNVLGVAKQKIDNARNSQVSTSESDKK